MESLEFEVGTKRYKLDPTAYGVDIFLNGAYLDTVQSENKKTKPYWLGRGVEYVMRKETKHV